MTRPLSSTTPPQPAHPDGFMAGTLVHTKEGLKPIEQIQVGDWVLSRPENPEDGTETAYKRVVKTFRFEDKPVVKFTWKKRPEDDPTGEKYADTTAKYDRVWATPNHPVWIQGHGWKAIDSLGRTWDFSQFPPKIVDNWTSFDEENWPVAKFNDAIPFTATVYNIEVEDWHTYFVGETGLWVKAQPLSTGT